MGEPTKPRFTVDLEEIDRQLRQSAMSPAPRREPSFSEVEPVQVPFDIQEPAHPSSENVASSPPDYRQSFAGSGHGSDPLQELARIVGQEDPFQSILGKPGTPPSRPAPATSDSFRQWPDATFDMAKPAQPFSARAETPLGASPEVGSLSEYLRSDGERFAASASQTRYPSYSRLEDKDTSSGVTAEIQDSVDAALQKATGGEYRQQAQIPAYDLAPPSYEEYTPSFADPKLGYQPEYEEFGEEDLIPRKPRRRGLLLGGAAVAVIAVAGIAYAMMGGGGMMGGGEPPLVTASDEPTKVAPETPGGKEFPDQNKQIYQGTAKEDNTQVVNREEQPVDIREATGARGAAASGDPFGETRQVRTVAVRPDGSFVGENPRSSSNGSPFPISASGNPLGAPHASNPPPAAPVVTATPSPQPEQTSQAAVQPSAAPTPPIPPQRAQTPTMAGTHQTTAVAQTPATAARPAQVAAVTTPAAPASNGSYAVQFGVSGSEAEGRTRFNRLKGQFPDILGSITPSIRAAEINGRTVYRIRSGGMSKEASDTLCSNFKAAGGDCYVARN